MSYTYSATGQKLRMSVAGEIRDYIGPFEYVNGVLSEIHTEEGRYTPSGGYEYFVRDHLGNVRSVIGSSGITQYSDYDPWGWQLPSLTGGSSSNRLKYNGKEAVGELGANVFDYGARFYDATIGRWGVVDPMAEVSRRFSPYVYGNNNPMRFIDPDGMVADESQRQNYQYSDGYGTYDSRSSTGSIEYSGLYQNSDDGPGPKPKPAGAPGTQQARQNAQQSNLASGAALPDYTLDGSFVLGAVLRPVGWLFSAAARKIVGGAASEGLGVSESVAGQYGMESLDDGVRMVNQEFAAGAGNSLTKIQLRSISSLENQIAKHEAKLAEYIKDPMKFDNKGFLQNAPNDAVRQKIIQSRVNHLNQEIQTFKSNIQKILNEQ